jgi:hypothetical protein
MPAAVAQSVTWSTTQGGAVSQSGLFTAPVVTASQMFIVTATSTSDTTKSGSFVISVTPPPAPPPPSATGPVNLGVGSMPSTVVDSNGVIDIAWITQTGIAFAQSQDNGVTFTAPSQVLPTPALAFQVSIQVDAQNDIVILATYNATGTLGASTAVLARSTDGGKTFSNTVAQQNIYEALLLVQASGVLDLAYTDSDDNGEDPDNALHESRSTDGGNTFGNDQLLWTTPLGSSDIVELRGVVGPQGQLYLTWTEQVDQPCEIYFIASLDGVNFQAPLRLTNTDVCNDNPTPVLDAAGNLDLAWETGFANVYFTRSTDQGQTFSTPASIIPSLDISNGQQFVVGANGEIDLVFDGVPNFPASPAPSQVYFTQSLDQGVTWSTPVNLALPNPVQSFTGAQDPHVGVDANGKITVAWDDDTNGTFSGDYDLYIRTSSDDGKTWSSPTDISNTTNAVESEPTVLVTPNGVRYIVWYDVSNANPANMNVFFYAVQ